jgi:hypothetical protein
MSAMRKTVISGLVGLGLVGAVAGGVGIASAATPGPAAPSSSALPYGGMHLGGMHFGGMQGMMASGQQLPIAAAATYLGLSLADLQARLLAGTSLADVAKAQGKSVSGLEDALVVAMTSTVNANGALSADQKAAMLALVKSHVATMVTTAHATGVGHPLGGMTGAGAGRSGMGAGMYGAGDGRYGMGA